MTYIGREGKTGINHEWLAPLKNVEGTRGPFYTIVRSSLPVADTLTRQQQDKTRQPFESQSTAPFLHYVVERRPVCLTNLSFTFSSQSARLTSAPSLISRLAVSSWLRLLGTVETSPVLCEAAPGGQHERRVAVDLVRQVHVALLLQQQLPQGTELQVTLGISVQFLTYIEDFLVLLHDGEVDGSAASSSLSKYKL